MQKGNNKINWTPLIQLALVVGIVTLAFNDKDGWGWLVFALLCTF